MVVLLIHTIRTFAAKSYQNHPKLTNGFTGFFTFASGDVIAQKLVLNPEKEIDFNRASKTGILGVMMNGIVLHHWYNILDRLFGSSMIDTKGVVLKMMADQLIFAPFAISIFFAFASTINPGQLQTKRDITNNNHDDAGLKQYTLFRQKMNDSFWKTYLTDCCVWPFVNVVNFRFIPRNYRPSFIGIAQLVWQTFMSSQGHAQLGDSEEIENEYRNIGELHI
mmetsp:Transcript_32092/g.30591  ORF Transcript_32092/g.30591 Transcript_32092/m.30591 type:complete len:222 (+) Transcript_32092:203-868(+)